MGILAISFAVSTADLCSSNHQRDEGRWKAEGQVQIETGWGSMAPKHNVWS